MALLDVNWNPPRTQLRSFGLISLVAFTALGAWAFFAKGLLFFSLSDPAARWTALGWWAAAAVCGLLAMLAPAALRPLYVALTAIALPIGFTISMTVLALIYFLIMTPVALVLRASGRDPMERRLDRTARSYWIARQPTQDVRRYYRQF